MKQIIYILIFSIFFVSCKSKKINTNESELINQNDTSEMSFYWPPSDPSFPGGFIELGKFKKENTNYPPQAVMDSIEGKVFVQFTINEDGSISEIEVVKSVSPILSDECVRVVKKMPNWIPSKFKGEPVKIKYTLPFRFCLKPEQVCDATPK